MSNSWDILNKTAEVVAPRLLGSELVCMLPEGILRARIVEIEAYNQDDAASHSYKGETPRTRVMFGPSGYLYVYFTYGMHYCCNVVCGPAGRGEAVLIRAVEPLEGESIMAERRGRTGLEVTNGPAKLCQAFGIAAAHNGHNLRNKPLQLRLNAEIPKDQIGVSQRIGVSQAKDAPLRFYIRGNRYVSGPRVMNRT